MYIAQIPVHAAGIQLWENRFSNSDFPGKIDQAVISQVNAREQDSDRLGYSLTVFTTFTCRISDIGF